MTGATQGESVTTRQRFLVLHMSDAAGAPWNPETDEPALQRWLELRDGPEGWPANGDVLRPADTARRITAHGGDVVVTDGPFPEFKEWFLGVEWIDARDIEEATRLLASHPTARIGRLYVVPAVHPPSA